MSADMHWFNGFSLAWLVPYIIAFYGGEALGVRIRRITWLNNLDRIITVTIPILSLITGVKGCTDYSSFDHVLQGWALILLAICFIGVWWGFLNSPSNPSHELLLDETRYKLSPENKVQVSMSKTENNEQDSSNESTICSYCNGYGFRSQRADRGGNRLNYKCSHCSGTGWVN